MVQPLTSAHKGYTPRESGGFFIMKYKDKYGSLLILSQNPWTTAVVRTSHQAGVTIRTDMDTREKLDRFDVRIERLFS